MRVGVGSGCAGRLRAVPAPLGFNLAMLGFLMVLLLAFDREYVVAKIVVAFAGSSGPTTLFERVLKVPLPYASMATLRARVLRLRGGRARCGRTLGAARSLDVSGLLEPRSVAVIGASDRSGQSRRRHGAPARQVRLPGPGLADQPLGRARRRAAGFPACRRAAGRPGPRRPRRSRPRPPRRHPGLRGRRRAQRHRLCGRARRGRRRGGRAAARARRALPRERASPSAARTASASSTPPCPRRRDLLPPRSPRSTRSGPAASRSSARAAASATNALSIIQQAGFGCRALVSSGNEAVVSFADYLHALRAGRGHAGHRRLPRGHRRQRQARARAGGGPAPAEAGRADQGRRDERERPRRPGPYRRPGRRGPRGRRGPARAGRDPRVLDRGAASTSRSCWSAPADRMPAGPGVGIVTFGGGNGVLAADQCAQYGLDHARRSGADVRRAAAPAARLGRDRGEPARPHADHGLPRGVARAAAGGARRHRRRAADPFGPRSSPARWPREGARDRRRHRRLLRDRSHEAGLRVLALAAARHSGAAGRAGRSTPSSSPFGACRRSPARGAPGRRSPPAAASGGRRACRLRLGGPRPRRAPAA